MTNSSNRVSLPDRPARREPSFRRVRRVVADLLESHQRGQDEAAPTHALGLLGVDEQLVDDLLVQRGLLLGELGVGDLLDLVRQVGEQTFVCLGTAQDERPGDPAESPGCVGGRRWVRRPLDR